MNIYLDDLKTKTSNDIPKNVRGRVMENFSNDFSNAIENAYDSLYSNIYYTGCDKNSCTSTTAGIFYFLHGEVKGKALELSEIGVRYDKKSFSELPTMPSMLQTVEPLLFTIFTKEHRFSVLRVGGKSCILQSNQDDFHNSCGSKYTLNEYLLYPISYPASSSNDNTTSVRKFINFKTDDELFIFFEALQIARTNPNECENIYNKYFGIKFKYSRLEYEYWFTVVTV